VGEPTAEMMVVEGKGVWLMVDLAVSIAMVVEK
jgi:hypothetical protein